MSRQATSEEFFDSLDREDVGRLRDPSGLALESGSASPFTPFTPTSADEDGQSRAIEAIITQYELSDPSAVIARVAKGSPHVMVSHLSREAPDLRCQLRVAIHIEWDREIILKSSTLEGWILFL